MAQVYTLHDDGTHSVSDMSFSELKSTNVYVIVNIDMKKLFIWKGSEAPVRQKFISARVAQDIRLKEYGMAYKVESEDDGEESSRFLGLFGVTAEEAGSASKQTGPVVTASPGSSASKPVAAARPVSTTPQPTKVTQPAAVQSTPRPASIASKPVAEAPRPRPVPTPTPSSSESAAPKTDFHVTSSAGQPSEDIINKTLEKLKELDEPEGMQREIVLIGNSVYSAHKEYHKLFKKEIVKLDPMDELPDGAFPANDYYTRLYMEQGKVLFIELFSETPASAREEFLADMRSSLRDLTKLGI